MKSSNKTITVILLTLSIAVIGVALFSKTFTVNDKSTQSSSKQITTVNAKTLYPKISSLQISGPFIITVEPKASTNLVTIFADEHIQNQINKELKSETLRISAKEDLNVDAPVRLHVKADNLQAVSLNGKVNLTITDINQQHFNIYANDDTKVQLSGAVEIFNASLHGQAQLNSVNMQAKLVNLDAHDHAIINLFASSSLNIVASGNTEINFTGSPKTINKTLYGNNKISRLGLGPTGQN